MRRSVGTQYPKYTLDCVHQSRVLTDVSAGPHSISLPIYPDFILLPWNCSPYVLGSCIYLHPTAQVHRSPGDGEVNSFSSRFVEQKPPWLHLFLFILIHFLFYVIYTNMYLTPTLFFLWWHSFITDFVESFYENTLFRARHHIPVTFLVPFPSKKNNCLWLY